MESWLEWARGPAFVFSFGFMVLGLVRHVILTLWETGRAMHRAGDKVYPYRQILLGTLKWLFPMGKMKEQMVFSITSMLFHIAILIVPIFLGGHIALWARGLRVSWPSIPNGVADVLTIVAIVTAAALVVQRVSARATRSLSRFQDYALPIVIALPFATGFLVMHPGVNPFSFQATLFVHIMSANAVFVLIPLTKLSHMVLLPTVQLTAEVGWHWPSNAGSKLGVTLGKEDVPI